MRQIEKLQTESGDKPLKDVVITDCGELSGDEAIASATKQPDSTGDMYEDFPEDSTEKLDATTILKIATDCKDFGNKAFKAADFAVALCKYEKGLRYLDDDPDLDNESEATKQSLNRLRFSLNNNAALLSIKQELWADGIRHATSALVVAGISDTDRAKALYRRGLALVRAKDEERALKDLEEAHRIEPSDALVANEMRSLKAKTAAKEAQEKAAYKKFFS